jgi:NAD(P)-dependent dehydrogenase (short-subunit alcohol dehydrogenase family)
MQIKDRVFIVTGASSGIGLAKAVALSGRGAKVALLARTAEAAERYGISDLDGYEPKSLRGIYGGPNPAFDIQEERSCLRQHRSRAERVGTLALLPGMMLQHLGCNP